MPAAGHASSSHFGLGLYICSLLEEKLGGGLQLSNGESGGAKVTIKLISYRKNLKGNSILEK